MNNKQIQTEAAVLKTADIKNMINASEQKIWLIKPAHNKVRFLVE